MDNFFNTLFGIEVTIFGIISAVILVFIQLIYSNYSYKHISHILRNKYLVLFIIFSTVDLLLTSVASFILSFYHWFSSNKIGNNFRNSFFIICI